MQSLWRHGPLSRWELHERTGLTPNRVGTLAQGLIRERLIRERPPESTRAGRPRVPLEIDPSGRHLLGLAIAPGGITVGRLGLDGVLVEQLDTPAVTDPTRLIHVAADTLARVCDARTLGIGVTFTGYLDPVRRSLLLSSALPGLHGVSLAPVYDAAGDVPVVLGNDMHALAARWLLTHRAVQEQDVLLVWFTDGRFGSAILVDGRPNHGCVTGGNELGHTRHFVETAPCFCGQTGCLERIVSTDFLRRRDRLQPGDGLDSLSTLTLGERVMRFGETSDPSLKTMLDYLCCSLSNAVNFVRPHRLVLASSLLDQREFARAVIDGTRALLLPEMADNVRLDRWDHAPTLAAENAAWLATAELFWTGWDAARPLPYVDGEKRRTPSPDA